MKPRYKMRWIVKQNKVTAEQVKQYATEHNLRMVEAKKYWSMKLNLCYNIGMMVEV